MNILKNIPYLLILVLVGIIFLQRCSKSAPVTDKPKIDSVVIHDTLRIHDTTKGKPVLVYSEPQIHWIDSGKYKPDTNYARLLQQYDSLGDEHFSRNIYKTPFKLGIYGDATVTDTIVSNKLVGNSIVYNIKIPVSRTVITIHEPYSPKNQVYIGGVITGNKVDFIKSAEVGILYKNKKDQIFQLKVEQPFNNTPTSFGVGTYWKIKF